VPSSLIGFTWHAGRDPYDCRAHCLHRPGRLSPALRNTQREPCGVLACLAAEPAATRDLTKTINAVMTHRFKQGAQGLPPLSHLRVFNPDATMALARQVIAFLQGHLKLLERVGAAFRGDQSQAQDIEPS